MRALGVREVNRHEKYLGLPTIIGRSKKAVFSCLKERIWKKLQGWKQKLLSRPGKEVLIKAVAQAIPTYMMSIFKIPDSLIDEIHAVLAKFWWGSNAVSRKIHWHSWETLCLPKSMGGMGFRDLKCFNQALLAKQGWRLGMDTPTLLHSVLKARYFKNSDFFAALRGFDPSYSWRSIWGAKSLLLEGLKWRVGNGESINVWEDSWFLENNAHLVPSPHGNMNGEMRVSELLDFENGGWNVAVVNATFAGGERQWVLDIPLPLSWRGDSRYWWPTLNGTYTVRSGYWLGRLGKQRTWELFYGEQERDLWRLVWSIDGPPKLKHFIWRACKGSLGVSSVLHRRHIRESCRCTIYGDEEETIMHSLFDCKHAMEIWTHSDFLGLLMEAPTTSFADRFVWLAEKLNKDALASFASLTWAAWFCRNKEVFWGGRKLQAKSCCCRLHEVEIGVW